MSDLTVPQDPNELFDVVTSEGQPTGIAKPRRDVHRDGDWHRAIHVWVVGIDDRGPFLTFQRRSLHKDTQPGLLDATVGGHFRAGEGLEQTLRETEEEIGVAVDLDRLRWIGMRVAVSETESGIRDHELQDVFLLRDNRPLTAFRPSPAELAGLLRISLDGLLDCVAGNLDRIPAFWIETGSRTVEETVVDRAELNVRLDRYVYRVAIAVERFLAGKRHVAV
jgi:isopentenyldiphosphate isomerase